MLLFHLGSQLAFPRRFPQNFQSNYFSVLFYFLTPFLAYYIARLNAFKTLQELVAHYKVASDGLCVALQEPCIKSVQPQTADLAHSLKGDAVCFFRSVFALYSVFAMCSPCAQHAQRIMRCNVIRFVAEITLQYVFFNLIFLFLVIPTTKPYNGASAVTDFYADGDLA